MGDLADKLDRMTIRASAPDRSVSAELHGANAVRLTFAPGAYHRTTEADLERRLAALGKVIWAGRVKGYRAAVESEDGEIGTRERATDPPTRRYYDRLDALVAEGSSADGRIRLAVRGGREWSVTIRPGTLRALHEDQFATRAAEAVTALVNDQSRQVARLEFELHTSRAKGGHGR